MSVIIATFSHGELMPSRADAFFRYHDQERTMVEETGDVESIIGHATLREVTTQDILDYVREHGDPWASMSSHLQPGWYVDVRGEDGTVWAFHYRWEITARTDFREAERVYADWTATIDD